MPLEQPKVESVAEDAQKIEFAAFSSILDIENNAPQSTEQAENEEDTASFVEDKPKKKGTAATVICIILAIATVVC